MEVKSVYQDRGHVYFLFTSSRLHCVRLCKISYSYSSSTSKRAILMPVDLIKLRTDDRCLITLWPPKLHFQALRITLTTFVGRQLCEYIF